MVRNELTIAVIIPALNEEAALPGVMARIPAWVDRIAVVDNGSTDRTAQVAVAAGATLVPEPARGYGNACLAGIAASPEADILVFLDGDGSDFPEQMDQLVDPIAEGRADIVIGSRTRGSIEKGAMTPPQRFGNMLAPALIRWLWGQHYTDLGPFRAIRVASLRQLQMDDRTYGWTVQMQIRAARFGIRSLEIPVDYGCRKAGSSKVSGTLSGVAKAGAKILACVARERIAPALRGPRTQERLAVFAKYPRPGQAKTRLIPALGPEGAAELHDQMIRHTMRCVHALKSMRDFHAELWHTGANSCAFAARFGEEWAYHRQVEGDLGDRMLHAFRTMLRDASAAVIIGTDCPELSPGLVDAAFEALTTTDVVLGPATDGGYYLIGLRRPVPGLFAHMHWSSPSVCAETLRRVEALGLSMCLLPTLDDVDEPEDLPVWESHRAQDGTDTLLLSIVVPTLNEADGVGSIIDSLKREDVEIIVADGGSTDGTRQVARRCGARVTLGATGRGPQLNAGASLARSDRLLFLHADTRLPERYVESVTRTLDDPNAMAGAFRFRVDGPGAALRAVESLVRLRCALFRTPYGDQGLFMRTASFRGMRGFARIPLMEDLDLVRRVRRKHGRRSIRILEEAAITSARRWAATGVVRMTMVNQACVLAHALGISPARLAAWRNRHSRERRAASREQDQSAPAGCLAPNATRAVSIATSDVEARK